MNPGSTNLSIEREWDEMHYLFLGFQVPHYLSQRHSGAGEVHRRRSPGKLQDTRPHSGSTCRKKNKSNLVVRSGTGMGPTAARFVAPTGTLPLPLLPVLISNLEEGSRAVRAQTPTLQGEDSPCGLLWRNRRLAGGRSSAKVAPARFREALKSDPKNRIFRPGFQGHSDPWITRLRKKTLIEFPARLLECISTITLKP